MARKTRRAETAQQVPAVPSAGLYPTAIYVRLSLENGGKGDEATIENQIDVCKEYVSACPDLQLVKVYQDNGYTGTSMHRPAFDELMADVKSGLISTIVVRDLSRFGRNYIETGTYLERIFPRLNVRFISVKEQFDTLKVDGTNESLMVPLQNLINDLYSKDLSKKIEAALKTQMEEGRYNWRQIPYGYKWNEAHDNIIPDEETAPFVRLMYERRLAGDSINKIAQMLDEKHAPTYGHGGKWQLDHWSVGSVFVILQNQAYIGKRIYGVTHKAIYKSPEVVKLPEDQWYVIENAHEPIVDGELFDAVQEKLRKNREHRENSMEKTEKGRKTLVDLLHGKVYCGDCGYRMRFRKAQMATKEPYYYGSYICTTTTHRRGKQCTSTHYTRQHVLEEKVLAAIKMQVKTAIDYDVLISKFRNSDADKGIRDQINARILSVQLRLNGLQTKRTRLYEDYVSGILDTTEYSYAKQAYDQEYEALNRQLDDLTARRNEYQEAFSADNKWISLMKSVRNARKLTKELCDTVVEKILIYEGGDIELIMKYQDVYELTLKCVSENIPEAADENR